MSRLTVLAIPMAGLWMVLSNQHTITSFLIGYFLGFATLSLIHTEKKKLNVLHLPHQLFWLVVYIGWLLYEIILSGLDVTRRVLDPRLPIKSEVIPVSTQDNTHNSFVSALSIHAICVTPGELVVDFEGTADAPIMYVHCLDAEASRPHLDSDQARRLRFIRRIFGDD